MTPIFYKHCNKASDMHTHHWLLLDRIRMIWLYVISLITSGLMEIFLYPKLQIRSGKCELYLKCFLSSAVWLFHAVFYQACRAKGHNMLQWLPESKRLEFFQVWAKKKKKYQEPERLFKLVTEEEGFSIIHIGGFPMQEKICYCPRIEDWSCYQIWSSSFLLWTGNWWLWIEQAAAYPAHGFHLGFLTSGRQCPLKNSHLPKESWINTKLGEEIKNLGGSLWKSCSSFATLIFIGPNTNILWFSLDNSLSWQHQCFQDPIKSSFPTGRIIQVDSHWLTLCGMAQCASVSWEIFQLSQKVPLYKRCEILASLVRNDV